MNVAFLNENTLGHTSYLPRFVEEFGKHPELGVVPYGIDVTPLPAPYARWGESSIRGLRKWGLDFHNARWRMAASRFAREQLLKLMDRCPIDAAVVNTQSVGLELADLAEKLPVFVCLDATFRQLERSRWFAPNAGSRTFLPLTAAPIRGRERELLVCAQRLLAWSEPVRESLVDEYNCPASKVCLLPPSVHPAPPRGVRKQNNRPQILFLGGDFKRKGGPVLLETYRRWFQSTCELHIVTESPISAGSGVFVHRNIRAQTEAWLERWRQADVFVFPSTLETFGIVLVEALSFGVPVISARVGAAEDILDGGRAGRLLKDEQPETLAEALRGVLNDWEGAGNRALQGYARVQQRYDLSRNTQQLADWLRESVGAHQTGHSRTSLAGVNA